MYKKEDSNLNERYELLFDILKNDLKKKLDYDNPKNINKIMKIELDNIVSCELKYCKYELDSTGITRTIKSTKRSNYLQRWYKFFNNFYWK